MQSFICLVLVATSLVGSAIAVTCSKTQNITIPALGSIGKCLGQTPDFADYIDEITGGVLVDLLGPDFPGLIEILPQMTNKTNLLDISRATCENGDADPEGLVLLVLELTNLVRCLPLEDILKDDKLLEHFGTAIANLIFILVSNIGLPV